VGPSGGGGGGGSGERRLGGGGGSGGGGANTSCAAAARSRPHDDPRCHCAYSRRTHAPRSPGCGESATTFNVRRQVRARWVTLRARWVSAKSSLGDAQSSLGDAKSSLGDAESSLGDAKSSLGDAVRLSSTLRFVSFQWAAFLPDMCSSRHHPGSSALAWSVSISRAHRTLERVVMVRETQ
jgi:hypothetical protein